MERLKRLSKVKLGVLIVTVIVALAIVGTGVAYALTSAFQGSVKVTVSEAETISSLGQPLIGAWEDATWNMGEIPAGQNGWYFVSVTIENTHRHSITINPELTGLTCGVEASWMYDNGGPNGAIVIPIEGVTIEAGLSQDFLIYVMIPETADEGCMVDMAVALNY